MRYLLIVALLLVSVLGKSQPYPASSWPNPLPSSNLNAVQVMMWMYDNGEIERTDLFQSNSGAGEFVRLSVSLTWLYGKSRLTTQPIKLTNWNGYAQAPPDRVYVPIGTVWSENAQSQACNAVGNELGLYLGSGSTIEVGSVCYTTLTGSQVLDHCSFKISGNRWAKTNSSGVVYQIGGC